MEQFHLGYPAIRKVIHRRVISGMHFAEDTRLMDSHSLFAMQSTIREIELPVCFGEVKAVIQER